MPALSASTDCGSGRRPPERGGDEQTPRQLLRMHADVAGAVR